MNLYATFCGAAAVLVPVGLAQGLADPHNVYAWVPLLFGSLFVGCIVPERERAS